NTWIVNHAPPLPPLQEPDRPGGLSAAGRDLVRVGCATKLGWYEREGAGFRGDSLTDLQAAADPLVRQAFKHPPPDGRGRSTLPSAFASTLAVTTIPQVDLEK